MTLTQINKAGLDEIALDHVFTIGASGSSAYTFQGEGLNGTVNNPTLYLTRGKTYRFENGSGGHPIRIQSTSGASGTAYNTGVTNNAGSGTVIVEVQHDAPDVLYYQCTSHAAMNGILYITGALADGGVTTAKIADNAVTTAKIADDAVTTQKINGLAVTEGRIANNAVTTDKIADDAVTQGKIAGGSVDGGKLASNAVSTVKIADEAVTLAKLPHGTSSNDGKFLRANNGADPTFETVNTDLVSDTSPQLGGLLSTEGNNIAFGDGSSGNGALNRLTMGASNDLQIFHDGSNSFIKDDGTGSLVIQSSTLAVNNAAGTEQMMKAVENGAVELNYDGTKRFETSSVGTKFTQATGGVANGTIKVNTDLYNYGSIIVRNQSHSNSTIGALEVENNGSGTDETNFVIRSVNLGSTQWAHAWYAAKSHKFGITSNSDGTEKVRIDAAGIKFNGDTATANALDDYEEGTFTPDWQGSNYGGTTTYSNNLASYTKIGNIVHIRVYSAVSSTTASGSWVMHGLPFASAQGNDGITTGSCMLENFNFDGNRTWVVPYKNPNTSYLYLYASGDDRSWYSLGIGEDTTFDIILGLTYKAA